MLVAGTQTINKISITCRCSAGFLSSINRPIKLDCERLRSLCSVYLLKPGVASNHKAKFLLFSPKNILSDLLAGCRKSNKTFQIKHAFLSGSMHSKRHSRKRLATDESEEKANTKRDLKSCRKNNKYLLDSSIPGHFWCLIRHFISCFLVCDVSCTGWHLRFVFRSRQKKNISTEKWDLFLVVSESK